MVLNDQWLKRAMKTILGPLACQHAWPVRRGSSPAVAPMGGPGFATGRLRVALGWLAFACLLQGAVIKQVEAQETLNAEVLVADQGGSERNQAYRLALDWLLRNVLPLDTVPDGEQRTVINAAGDYVQSFRYGRADPAVIGRTALATVKAREPAATPSLLTVTFPAELAELIQVKLAPEQFEPAVEPENESILALIAVDQQGSQMLIGGKTGVKFQNRAVQLAASSDLELLFPRMDQPDRDALEPADVLFDQRPALDLALERYAVTRRLTGALIRLASGAWQSEWRYSRPGAADSTYRLTTSNLDEALVTVIGEISESGQNGGNELDPLARYGASTAPAGVALRIDNITTLAHYHQVLELVQGIDAAAVPESVQARVVTFRVPGTDTFALEQGLAASRQFTPFTDPAGVSFEPAALNYRFIPR